jgi:hypothetical protein
MILALVAGEGPASHPSRFTSREVAPGTHWVAWVGPRASVDNVETWNSMSNPYVTPPVASHYADYAIMALYVCLEDKLFVF